MSIQLPILDTTRLTLRPFAMSDAPDVKRLAGELDVAKTTLNIPHPYEDGMAEEWIASQQQHFEEGRVANFAVTVAKGGELCGNIGLVIQRRHNHAELGYWLGLPYWGQGFCTEGAQAVIAYAFETLELHRVYSCHMTRNPASGRVMQKLGMTYEGRQREHLHKWGRYEDIELYGILASQWKRDR